MNDNRSKIIEAIWADPSRAFGCPFRNSGRYLENLRGGGYDEGGKIRLLLSSTGTTITVFYNGSSRPEKSDALAYLQEYVLNTSSYWDTLQRLAEIYGITLQISDRQRDHLNRQELARIVVEALKESLRSHPDGPAAVYLQQRGYPQPWAVEVGENLPAFGELTEESIQAARERVRRRKIAYNEDDYKALGLTKERAKAGYNVVIPYYSNGVIQGIIYRNIRPNSTAKYLYSEGLGRPGYCGRLEWGKPTIIVEGQLDALRLITSGISGYNVVGMGGAKVGEEAARLLKGRNITEVIYIPDQEYNTTGKRKTDLIREAVRAFEGLTLEGEKVIRSVEVADLPPLSAQDLATIGKKPGEKIDADDYGRINPDALAEIFVFKQYVPSWKWELSDLLRYAEGSEEANIPRLQDQFNEIYTRQDNPYTRQLIRNYISEGEAAEAYKRSGVTPDALAEVDEWYRGREYQSRVREASRELSRAVAEQADANTVGKIIDRLNEARQYNTRDTFTEQLNESFQDELDNIKKQPDTLRTRWEVGKITSLGPNNKRYNRYEYVEFYPADITVFCAPTSHGKTMVLFQSVLDIIQTTGKTFLYVSCEENKRQLLERALNVWLPIASTHTGKTPDGRYCFIKGTRKKAIKAIIRKQGPPPAYEAENGYGYSEHWEQLTKTVEAALQVYGREIFPRLRLVHSDASTESICSNIRHYVRDSRVNGVEVAGVFVDYMQLLHSENKAISRNIELKDICKSLKELAADTELPVIIAAQLNRETLKQGGLDNLTTANIGEGADIERIAHDIYMIWQVDKTPLNPYYSPQKPKGADGKPAKDAEAVPALDPYKLGVRSRRLFTNTEEPELKEGYLYIEQMKARDGRADGWALLPFDGERGHIGEIDTDKMTE